MPLAPIILIFALVNTLWFGASFLILLHIIVSEVVDDYAHSLYGYGVAMVQAAAVAGWVWALCASARARTPVNGPVQIMCAATAAAQIAIVLATIALIGGWVPGGRANLFLTDVVAGVLLAVQIGRSTRQ